MKIGFIGTGYMGSAIARAVVKVVPGEEIYLSNRTVSKAQKLADEIGAHVLDNAGVARTCDYIFLCVKPQFMKDVFDVINPVLKEKSEPFVLISMMAGHDVKGLQEMAQGDYPVIHMSPNTPAAVGSGMTFYCMSENVTEEMETNFKNMMQASGRVDKILERYMGIAGHVTGCGPAYVAMFIEALADGAVACGLPRATAYEYAAEMIKGSADLFLKDKLSPSQMKDAVCSPGGITIQGVRKLEEKGFRSAVVEAIIANYEKKL